MYGFLLIAYIVALIIVALVVSEFFPAFAAGGGGAEMGPIGSLFLLGCILCPTAWGYQFPEYLRTHYFFYDQSGPLERLAQIVGGLLMFYITIRGSAVWMLFCLTGIILTAAGAALSYIF
jgi:hypothetical protein